MTMDDRVAEARAYLHGVCPFSARTGIILGSGLGSVRRAFRTVEAVPYGSIPHFPVSTVLGHRGELVFAKRGSRRVVILDGRVHCYEGYPRSAVTFPARVLGALGVTAMVVTNASGAVSGRLKPGDIMLIEDHVDLIRGAAVGLRYDPHAVRRPYYSARLTDLAEDLARAGHIRARRGVILGSTGPAYETRAEAEFARALGADAVTMSTVPEVTVCHQIGISVLGLSLITNVAASHGGGHDEVIDFAAVASRNLRALIVGVLEAL